MRHEVAVGETVGSGGHGVHGLRVGDDRRVGERGCPGARARRGVRCVSRPHGWILGPTLVIQNHWKADEDNDTGLGPGAIFEKHITNLPRVALGVELGATALFRQGEVEVPTELSLNVRLISHKEIVPYLGGGPVLALDFGSEFQVRGGAQVTFGLALRSSQILGFLVGATYRMLGGHTGFEQQMAFFLGPTFYL